MRNNKVIVIVGPTASGKTKLAVTLAAILFGEIISADSRQVYKGMDIGTGKELENYELRIPARCKAGRNYGKVKIPYHLIDVVSPIKQFTVADFQKRAYAAIEDILARGKVPIICGGTGLYVDAVVEGYILPISNYQFLISNVRKRLNGKTLSQLLALLKRVDKKTYKIIDKKNRRRVQRSVEMYYGSGIPKSKQSQKKKPEYEFLKIGIRGQSASPASGPVQGRQELGMRIAERLDRQFQEGMVSEVQRLHKRGVSWKRMEEFGLEYRWVARFIRGKISQKEMKENLLRDIKRYAKRQMTWFKRDMNISWIESFQEAEKIAKRFINS